MSRKFRTILLAFLFFYTSGVAEKANAQMKSLTLPTMNIRPDVTCKTLLQTYFVIQNDTCEDIHLSQRDLVAKAIANAKPEDDLPTFSYSTESTYYVEPTETPTPTPTEAQTPPPDVRQTPVDNVPADTVNLDSNLIFQLINEHRAEIGKPAFQKDDALCTLATTRSLELHDELFVNHNLHSGLYNRNLPYWITEDAKWGSNEAGTVQ